MNVGLDSCALLCCIYISISMEQFFNNHVEYV